MARLDTHIPMVRIEGRTGMASDRENQPDSDRVKEVDRLELGSRRRNIERANVSY